MIMRITQSSAAGFTLVEMLVTLTLLGLVTVVAFGGLRFGTRAWEAGASRAADISEIEAVQNFLRRQMSRTFLPEDLAGQRSGAVLRGDGTAFQFLTVLPPDLGVGGIALFRLYRDHSLGTGRLAMDLALYRPDGLFAVPDPAERSRGLLDGVRDLRFRYFGALHEGEGPGWWDTWPIPDRLPDLVSLEVAFADGDPRRWPALSVALRRAVMSIRP
jgi:general secretion pathway protein J